MLGTPTRDRQAERREATRREILDAAWTIALETGLSAITLRGVATQVGMRAPSLYTHFDSKNAIFDAMYAEAWTAYEESQIVLANELDSDPRTAIHQLTRHFYDFATADLARHQLMNQRILPGFEPTPESYAPAVRVLERGAALLLDRGVSSRDDFDIWVALLAGLINQHHANDPGGSRNAALLDRAVDMWADGVGLPATPTPSRKAR